MSEEKMIRNSVAAALGITSIILAVGLVVAIANYALIIDERQHHRFIELSGFYPEDTQVLKLSSLKLLTLKNQAG